MQGSAGQWHRFRYCLALLALLALPALPLHAQSHTRGIDVSRFQGTINWTKVAADSNVNVKFVYIKATEGTSMRDPNYKTNITKARKAGLLAGFYHVYNRGVGKQILFETKVDYLYFLKLMKEKGGEYNIVLNQILMCWNIGC